MLIANHVHHTEPLTLGLITIATARNEPQHEPVNGSFRVEGFVVKRSGIQTRHGHFLDLLLGLGFGKSTRNEQVSGRTGS